MRVAIGADLHGRIPDIEEDFEAMFLAGDLTNVGYDYLNPNPKAIQDMGKIPLYRQEMQQMCEWLRDVARQVPLFLVPGNHDIGAAAKGFGAGHNVYNKVVNFRGMTIGGACFCQAYENPNLALKWDYTSANWSAERSYYENLKPCNVLISHSPPEGSLSVAGEDPDDLTEVGSVELRNWILEHEPILVICGHNHDEIGEEFIGNTRVINTATKVQVIEIDI